MGTTIEITSSHWGYSLNSFVTEGAIVAAVAFNIQAKIPS